MKPPPEPPAPAVRVLVVDDDAVDRERLRRMLPRAGFDAAVTEATDPVAALAVLRRGGFDVVLLDHRFPRHDGLVVLDGLREHDLTVPVIALTGHDDTDLAVSLMKAGAVDYLVKGALTPERLGRSLRHALRLHAADQAARAAQQALRASEEFARRVLESSHDCIKVLDLDGRIQTMNPQGLRALGLRSLADVRGRPWTSFWSDDQRPAAEQAVAAAAAAGVGRFIGHTAEDDGAAVRWWDVVIAPILGDDGRPERLVATSRDITDQQRRAAFEQQLLGIVSHDLRTPLSAVAMGAAVLARQLPVESPLASIVARIASSSRRATRLVRDLLDLTQVRVDGKLPISRVPADLHAICRQVVDELRLGHPAHTLVLATDGDGAGRWDPDRLAQAVENLVSNALRYGDPDAPVTVRCARGDGLARVTVHNLGAPIPAAVIPTLFEPYRRGDLDHPGDRSIGLGLFIVREIVAAHRGAVSVASDAATGTTFTIALPDPTTSTESATGSSPPP